MVPRRDDCRFVSAAPGVVALVMGSARHDSESAVAPTAATESDHAVIGNRAAVCSRVATGHHLPSSDGAGGSDATLLMHLCLGVLAAVGGLLTAGLMLRWTLSPAEEKPVPPRGDRGRTYRRPLMPLPRRLAALCVFRL